jgi:hypothetical protein
MMGQYESLGMILLYVNRMPDRFEDLKTDREQKKVMFYERDLETHLSTMPPRMVSQRGRLSL